MKEWFTSLELSALALPDMPGSQRGINKRAASEGWDRRLNELGAPLAKQRDGRGGGLEYHYSLLPTRAQHALVAKDLAAKKAVAAKPVARGTAERWAVYEAQPDHKKVKATARLNVLDAVEALVKAGQPKNVAVATIAQSESVSTRSIYDWFKLVEGIERRDWLPFLLPQHKGGGRAVEIPAGAWEAFKADYLRPEQPTAEACFRRLERLADEHEWELPALRTFKRRIEKEVPAAIQIVLREGTEALERLYPYQERDRSIYHALEAVTADGHKCDVMVRWPDGDITRPQVVAIQDLYSNKIIGWRVDKSLTATGVRLAFYDVFRDYGIPDHAYLDNGREFAAKLITGGAKTRYRFKVKDDEPLGVLTQLGVQVHWTTPYHGQSKPIERAFKDWAGDMAKDPRLAGAYTGNRPDAKPSNYGKSAAPLNVFLAVLDEYILEANARTGRRTQTCAGKSFDQAFMESYAASPIRRATKEQLCMAMLAAEQITARAPDGSLHLMDSRFWDECLTAHIGQRLTVRFDPEDITAGVHVYRQDGVKIGFAECLEVGAFNSLDAARKHSRNRREYMKAVKLAAKHEVTMSIEDIAAAMPKPEIAPETPSPAAVRLVAGGGGRAMPVPQRLPEDSEELIDFRERLARGLKLVSDRFD